MKKTLFTFFLMLTFCFCDVQTALAQHIIGEPVELSVYIDDNQGGGNITPKTPIQPPICYCFNHLLVFSSPHSTLEISLMDSQDNIVYSATLLDTENALVLPQFLSGNFVVWIDDGSYMYYGRISL